MTFGHNAAHFVLVSPIDLNRQLNKLVLITLTAWVQWRATRSVCFVIDPIASQYC